jgi:hypothetical protein
MNPVFTFILECLAWCLRWVMFLIIVALFATPVILVAAIFRPRPYRERVREMYAAVFDFWRSWGWDLAP